MESSDGLYLLFASGKYYFLVPVSWVQRVADGNAREGPKGYGISLTKEAAVTGPKYRIYLEEAEVCLSIGADQVVEIRNLVEEQMIPLGPPVINKSNRFLKAVVPMKLEEEQIMAYVLEPANLAGKK